MIFFETGKSRQTLQQEAKPQASEEKQNGLPGEILTGATARICLHDLSGNIIRANNEMSECFEVFDKNGKPKNIRHLIVCNERHLLSDYLKRIVENQYAEGIQRLVDKNGNLRCMRFEARLEQAFGADSVVSYVRWSGRDIGGEQPEASPDEFYRSLFAENPQPILLLNAGGRIMDINEAAVRLLRRSSVESIVGLPFCNLLNFATVNRRQWYKQIIQAWKNGQAACRWTEKNASGDLRHIEALLKKTRRGREEILTVFLNDVTHRQERQELITAQYGALKIVKEMIRSVSGMYRDEDILMTVIARLYELSYIKGAAFYRVSKDACSARLKFFFNINSAISTALQEIETARYPTIFLEKQSLELSAGTLGSEQTNHLFFVPVVVENKTEYALLFELDDSMRDSLFLLNLLGTEIGSLMTWLRLTDKLMQSENRFRIIADNSPALLRTADANGNFIFFNRLWYKLTGADEQQAAITWTDYVHPEEKPRVLAAFNENLLRRQNFEVGYRLRMQNGEYRRILESGMPYFDEGNRFQGFIFSAVEFTERTAKESQTARAATWHYSQASLESALEKEPVFALTVESDGSISYCNRFLLQNTGWSEETLKGLSLGEVLVSDRADFSSKKGLPFYERLLGTFDGKLRCADGKYLHCRFNAVVWNNPDGQPPTVTLVGENISQSLRTQQGLEQTKPLLQDLFNNVNDLIQITDESGQFLFVNKAWHNILEYSPEDARTMRLADIVHPDHALALQHTLKKAAAERAVINFETCFVSRSGRKVSLRGSISYGSEEGNPAVYRAVLQDVTEQMRAEKAQTLYYNLSRLTVNSTNPETLYHNFYMELKKAVEVDSFLIALRNEKDQSVYFPYYVNSDYAPDEGIQGRAFAEYALAFDRPMFFYGDMLRRIMQSNDIPIEEPLPQTWMGVPLKIDQKVIGILVLQSYKDRKLYNKRDLDLLNFISGQLASAIQRAQNQEKINEQNARLQAIFESGQHLMWSVNKDLLITRFNGNYANTMRALYDINLTTGMSLTEIYRQNDREQVYFWLDKYKLAFAGYPQQFERKMTGINGEEYWFEVFLSPIVTTNSFEVDEVAGVAHNITVKKKAADELRLAKELAEHSLEVKKRFLSNMSHEIRTPMNGIIGMIDLLSEAENLEPEYRQYINTIKKSSETLLHILNDILDLSKIEAGKMELRKTPISLVNMMDKLIALFQQRALQKDIEFGYTIAPDVPHFIIADETRLLQILSNLTSNALKFTEKGSIRIALEVAQPPPSDEVLLDEHEQGYLLRAKVIDTGIGIAPEHRELLFQKFSQLDNSYTKSHGGTGLGLAISQELCRLMNGEIGVESEPGKGSTFWFTFRAKACRAEDVITEEQEHQREAQIGGQIPLGTRILIVDDNSVNLNVARSILKRAGCNVSIARSGKEALEAVQRQTFDLIFMDVQMPVMNGIETTRQIKQLGLPHLPPIVAMTAFSMQEERESFLREGMDDFIAKPIKARALIAKVKEILTNQRLCTAATDEEQPNAAKESVAEETAPEIINPEVIAQMTKYGGREMVEETYTEFDRESQGLLEALAMHISEKQFDAAKSILHTLKGNAGTLGIERLHIAVAAFEAAIKKNQVQNAQENFAEIVRLFTEFQQRYKAILQISS